MTQPDNVLIAQVMLYSQGFRTSEILAHKILSFFFNCVMKNCQVKIPKSILVVAGNVKREKILSANDENKISENSVYYGNFFITFN